MYCPECSSSNVIAGKRGMDLNKAFFGGFAFGMSESNEDVWICRRCGNKWKKLPVPPPLPQPSTKTRRRTANSVPIEVHSVPIPIAAPDPGLRLTQSTPDVLARKIEEEAADENLGKAAAIAAFYYAIIFTMYVIRGSEAIIYYHLIFVVIVLLRFMFTLLSKELDRE